ncbi:hypothetical protein HRG_008605 [Hirsutella rhossiliensis]|uniref:Uncharacterized protein n=1 Tax=Hirsutella rhossiliensis TaxID=111463 RepID=A0A9P8MSK3_9HYPO|nr:uncharacterized protein HRG_08605 [Hirsutella rhossiliensis]KAH0960450.1 hypothetical protein HRG_08605 [Hirsutella rhossiliensis]
MAFLGTVTFEIGLNFFASPQSYENLSSVTIVDMDTLQNALSVLGIQEEALQHLIGRMAKGSAEPVVDDIRIIEKLESLLLIKELEKEKRQALADLELSIRKLSAYEQFRRRHIQSLEQQVTEDHQPQEWKNIAQLQSQIDRECVERAEAQQRIESEQRLFEAED